MEKLLMKLEKKKMLPCTCNITSGELASEMKHEWKPESLSVLSFFRRKNTGPAGRENLIYPLSLFYRTIGSSWPQRSSCKCQSWGLAWLNRNYPGAAGPNYYKIICDKDVPWHWNTPQKPWGVKSPIIHECFLSSDVLLAPSSHQTALQKKLLMSQPLLAQVPGIKKWSVVLGAIASESSFPWG